MTKVKGKRPESKGANLKKYRSLYAEAKRRGLVKGNHDARSFVPSDYMKTKLNKLSPYMDSNYQSVKVSPKVAKMFKELKGANVPVVSNNRVLVRAGSSEQAVLRKGYPAKIQRLKAGTYEEIILPVQVRTFRELEEVIQSNPIWDEVLKDPMENFRFTFGGSIENGAPSVSAYDNLEELIADLSKYHWSNGEDEIGEEDDFEFEGVFHIYREYKDWNFPEYYAAQQKRRKETDREYDRKRQERKARRLAALPEAERERIRKKRYERRKNSKAYINELDARIAARKKDTPDAEEKRRKDRERKRKARAAAKAKQGKTSGKKK